MSARTRTVFLVTTALTTALGTSCASHYYVPDSVSDLEKKERVRISLGMANANWTMRFDGQVVGGDGDVPTLDERGFPLFGSPSRWVNLAPGQHRIDFVTFDARVRDNSLITPRSSGVAERNIKLCDTPPGPSQEQVEHGLGPKVHEWRGPGFYEVVETTAHITSVTGDFSPGTYEWKNRDGWEGAEVTKKELPCIMELHAPGKIVLSVSGGTVQAELHFRSGWEFRVPSGRVPAVIADYGLEAVVDELEREGSDARREVDLSTIRQEGES